MSQYQPKKGVSRMLLLALGALGVVYGDIGTSPLYAINEIFFGHATVHLTPDYIIGAISLVIWALTIIVTFKYIMVVLRADNEGEGGVFALYSLIYKYKFAARIILLGLLTIGCGLLFGDGIITPAISVISAVEGLKIATNSLAPFIVPITILILTGLFLIQSKGTHKVGRLFGPIVLIWFVSIASIGLLSLVNQPTILLAFNPIYAISFISKVDIRSLMFIMGAAILVVTGGEAMYADLGHFGAKPIRISWLSLVYPSLILNYLGQGAYMLSGKEVQYGNIFYSMVPGILLIPMIILATCATIIASQALISGAFSIASQAISLGLLPYTKVTHTNEKHYGQIYVPFVNWALYIGCVSLVLVFQSSSRLASAYGLAVAGDMLITSLCVITLAHLQWKWPTWKVVMIFLPIIPLELLFLASNSIKIFEGGYIPLSIGVLFLVIIRVWRWGRKKIKRAFLSYPATTVRELITMNEKASHFIPRSYIIMSPDFIENLDDRVPALKMVIDRYGILPQHIIFLNVKTRKTPHVSAEERFKIVKFYDDPKKGSIVSVRLRFGFMESKNVEEVLSDFAAREHININLDKHKWLINVLHERIIFGKSKNILAYLRVRIFSLFAGATQSADIQFGLGINQPLTAEIVPVVLS